MEDTSYVSLSLEKYNELYDKAKAYDEMQAEEGAKAMTDFLKDIASAAKVVVGIDMSNEKESAATEEPDNEIKVGDKVEIINDKLKAKVGVIGKVIKIDDDGFIKIYGNDSLMWCTYVNCVKKINEGEEK